MKTTNWMPLVALAALALACDPYESTKGGTPDIMSVTAANLAGGTLAVEGAPGTGGAWTITGVTCGSVEDPPGTVINSGQYDQNQIFITFDRQVNGGLVQTSPTDCTPAANWATITPAPPAGSAWYTCYSPSSPKATEGGSVVLYLGPSTGSDGWGDAEYFSGTTPVHITGTVAGRAIDVTMSPPATCP